MNYNKESFLPLSNCVLLLSTFLLVNLAVGSAQEVDTKLWIPNGEVKATALSPNGDILYVGGTFDYVHPFTLNGIMLSLNADSVLPGWPKVYGNINAVISDNNGGWFIGGSFKKVGEHPCEALAHITKDGTIDTTFIMKLRGEVHALVLKDSTLYIGGNHLVGKYGEYKFAAFNVNNGKLLWGPVTKNYDDVVYSVAVSDSLVCIGGSKILYFYTKDQYGNLNLANWTPKMDGTVRTLLIEDSTIFIGGKFTTIGSVARTNLASYNTSSKSVTGWNPNPNEVVYTLASKDSTIYAAGDFSKINGKDIQGRIAAIHKVNGRSTDINTDPDLRVGNPIYSLFIKGDTIYAAGSTGVWKEIPYKNLKQQIRGNLFAMDLKTGKVTSWSPLTDSTVKAIAIDKSSNVYAGGYFRSGGGIRRAGIVALNTKTGRPTAWNPEGPNFDLFRWGSIYSIATDKSTIYIGGDFIFINDSVTQAALVAFDEYGNITSWKPNIGHYYGNERASVNSIIVKDDKVFAGGSFQFVNSGLNTTTDTVRQSIAAFNNTDGAVLPWNPARPGTNYAVALVGTISTMAIQNSVLYVGGSMNFSKSNKDGGEAVIRQALVGFNTNTAEATNLTSEYFYGNVKAIAVNDSIIYTSGYGSWGSLTDETAAYRIHNSGRTSWDPNKILREKDIRFTPLTFSIHQSNLYMGGVSGLYGVDLQSGVINVFGPQNPQVKGTINTINIDPRTNTLYAGGRFIVAKENAPVVAINLMSFTIPGVVSVNESAGVDDKKGFVFPNPAHNFITITNEFSDVNYVIEVYSFLGEKIYSKRVLSGDSNKQINTSNFPSGSYICRITTPKGIQISRFTVIH